MSQLSHRIKKHRISNINTASHSCDTYYLSEKLKNDIESKNEAIQTEFTTLESKRESIANIESKRNSKNNDEVRLDSNGDEIVYEIRHNATWWDFLVFGAIFLFGTAIVCGTIIQQVFLDDWLLLFLFGSIPIILSTHHIFYIRNNKIYITHQGIGFERRKWFRVQKRFFKFGKVGMVMADAIALSPVTPLTFITIFPIGNIKKKCFFHWQLKPYCIIRLMAWDTYLSPKLYNKITEQDYLHEFLVKKTKEALESQGIDTKVLPYDLDKQFDI